MPSVICFTGPDQTEVGREAYIAAKNLDKTLIYDVKRLIGKLATHPEIEKAK